MGQHRLGQSSVGPTWANMGQQMATLGQYGQTWANVGHLKPTGATIMGNMGEHGPTWTNMSQHGSWSSFCRAGRTELIL